MRYRFDEIAYNSTAKKKPTEDDKETYIGLEHLDSECLTISRWGSEVAPVGEKLIMKKGDILFGKRRAYQRKVGIAPFDGIFSAHGMVLRPNEEVINPNFFPFFISSDQFMERAVRISVGGLSPTINWKDLREQEFDIPSLDEQKELADKLWAAYNLKESYKKLLSATDEMVKSQFIEMFEGDKYPRISLDAIADEWLKGQAFKKDEICENGDKHCIHYGELFTKYGPVIKEVVSKTSVDLKKPSKNGDILFPASDVTPNGLARCSMLPYDNVVLGGDIIVLRPKEGYSPAYLSYAINQQTTQLLARVNGGLVKHLSAKGLKTVEIPIPSKEKQEEYIRIAEQADKSKFISLKSQFIEMFKDSPKSAISDFCKVEKGTTITRNEVIEGNIPVVAGGQEPSCYHNVANRKAGVITISASGAYSGFVNYWTTQIFASDCNTIIPIDEKNTNVHFLYHGLKAIQKEIYSLQKGGAQPHVYGKDIEKFLFPYPTKEEQDKFADIAQQADKSKYMN